MKMIPALLLLATAVPAAAQQTEIIGLTHDGRITWTNELTNAYCGIEWTVNLRDSWADMGGVGWDLQTTSHVMSVDIPLSGGMGGLEAVVDFFSSEWPGYAARCEGAFFRIVSSGSPLGLLNITNTLVVTNASASALSNLQFNVNTDFGTSSPVTNLVLLAPSAVAPPVSILGPRLSLGWFDWTDIRHPNSTNLPGWFITWQQNGTNRHCGTPLVPYGKREKTVTVTVYSNRVETYFNWLGPGGTVPY